MEVDFKPSDLKGIEDIEILKSDRKNDITVSIIIPCYNVEKYIDRCMRSIVNQTIGIKNLQVILINDASTDNTLDKLKKWRELFCEEIIIISYKENLRQGGARNLGMQCADGEYIGFVDSDDWIEPDMYERLYDKIKDGEYDVVRGKYRVSNCERKIEIVNEISKEYCYKFDKRNGWYIHKISDSGVNGELGGIWSAIYRKDIIIENNVWFPEKVAYEDNYWGSVLGLYISGECIIDRIVYNYFADNSDSTVRTRNAPHQLDRLNTEVLKVEQYKLRGAFETLYHELECEFIQLFYLNTLNIIFTKFDYIPEGVYSFMKEKIYLYFPDFMKNTMLMSKLDDIERRMLSLLEIPKDLDDEELNIIKTAFLEILCNWKK